MPHSMAKKALLSSVPTEARITIAHVNLVCQMGMNLPSPVLGVKIENRIPRSGRTGEWRQNLQE
jgi:hypothetical protein